MRTRIIDKISRVLYKSHTHQDKRKYLESKGRLNFACTYCGDSSDNPRKKRGNLYWDDLYFHCYNCSAHVHLDQFLEDHNQNFEGTDRVDVINYINENRKHFSLGESIDFHLFEKINKLSLSFDEISTAFNVYPINENTYKAYPYLRSRFLHKKLSNFGYNPRTKELFVFNKTPDDKIIGFQIRSLSGIGPKYRTWNIERIYDRLNLDLNVSDADLDNLNKISMLFGILSVDMSRTFTVFEGPIDSFFMSNTIGLTGVKKQIIEFDEISTVRYMFDNDREGIVRMIEKLKRKNYVFMWDKFLSQYKISKKKVKDFNDLIKYEFENKTGCLGDIDKYFTNDPLDIIYI